MARKSKDELFKTIRRWLRPSQEREVVELLKKGHGRIDIGRITGFTENVISVAIYVNYFETRFAQHGY